MSLYELAVKRPITTVLTFTGIALIGLFSLSRLPVDLYPKIETNALTVVTSYPGAGASDIETNITRPLENTLNTVENIKKIASASKDNISLVSMEFNYGTNMSDATNDVRDKIDMIKAQLPANVSNPMIFKFGMDMIPVVIFSATAKENIHALHKILDEKIANPLNRIEGVGAVSISGAPKRQIQINVIPEKLEAYHLTVEQIASVIQAENLNVPVGSFDVGTTTYSLRVEGEFKESDQLLNVVLENRDGKNVYLKDVAILKDTIQSRVQESYTNEVKGAMIVIQKQSGFNTVEVAKKIHKIIPALQKTLPPDVQLSLVMDTSSFIQESINSLKETIVLAGIFVILVVLFFLGRWRATIIIILAIPISLISSFIYLMITGNSINIISLSSISIAVGMVVDDAIVVLENITKHIEMGSTPKEASIYATNEVGIAVIASSLTIIAVFFPLTMVTGMTGVLFKQLGWMVTIMISASVVVALSLTPMLCSQMLRLTHTQGKLFDRLYVPIRKRLDRLDLNYAKWVNVCVRNRWKTLICCFVLFLLIMIPSCRIVKFDFMPASDNSSITMEAYLPPGTRMEVARRTALKIDSIIKVKYVKEMRIRAFSVGQDEGSSGYTSVMRSGASNLISFRFRCIEPDKRKHSIYDIADKLRKELSNLPELYKYKVVAGGSGGFGGGGSSVDVEIYGYDLALTDTIACELKTRLESVKGLRDVSVSRQDYQMEYQVDFDRAKLAESGLNSATLASYIRNRINGSFTSKYREDGNEYDIVVRYDESRRQSIEDIENSIVYTNTGVPIKIRELGKVVEKFSLPQIDRQNRQRIVKVQGSLYRVALSEVVEGITKEIEKMKASRKIPSEIGIHIGGSYEEQQDSNRDLRLLILLCILLVYIVMAAQFESFTYPFIIILSLIFGLAGVFLALVLAGKPMSLMAMIGLVMLIGIVVKNGIVFIDYANLNRKRGMSIDKAIISAGKSRLRPILMTTATTIFGMIPLAISRGGSSVMWQPMGITIVGGLTLSTLLTLVYVPALYSIFGVSGVKRRRKYQKQTI